MLLVSRVCAARRLCAAADSLKVPALLRQPAGAAKGNCGRSHWPLPLIHRSCPGHQHPVKILLSSVSSDMLLTGNEGQRWGKLHPYLYIRSILPSCRIALTTLHLVSMIWGLVYTLQKANASFWGRLSRFPLLNVSFIEELFYNIY